MPGDSEQPVTVKTEIPAFKRLPSFRTPRDLKLSEFRDIRPALLNENRNKRVFIPNLNIQRRKQSDDSKNRSTPNNESSKQKEYGKREERGRGRGRGRKQVSFIQSAGVFSEGLAPTLKHWHNRQSSGEASTSIPKPKLNFKESAKVNKEQEEEVMKELLRDDIIEDSDIQPDLHHCPVKLPLQDCKDFVTKCEVEEVHAKDDNFHKNLNGIKVKREPETYEEKANVNDLEEDVSKPLSLTSMRPFTISQLLAKSSEKSFLFFQIPNCLPKMKVNMGSAVPNINTDSQKNEIEESEKCVLRNLPPGRIGKLQILKSGKAMLILGDVKLWVESGTQTAFKQDLISVNLDPNQKTGNMINMGDLTTRIVITPDWESLLLKHCAG